MAEKFLGQEEVGDGLQGADLEEWEKEIKELEERFPPDPDFDAMREQHLSDKAQQELEALPFHIRELYM